MRCLTLLSHRVARGAVACPHKAVASAPRELQDVLFTVACPMMMMAMMGGLAGRPLP